MTLLEAYTAFVHITRGKRTRPGEQHAFVFLRLDGTVPDGTENSGVKLNVGDTFSFPEQQIPLVRVTPSPQNTHEIRVDFGTEEKA